MTNKEIGDFLKSKNIMPSSLRIAIYSFLDKNRIHPTADEIYQALLEDNPSISKTTIYNNLKIFLQAKLIIEIIIEDDKLRYDVNTSSHCHFKCLSCGEVSDICIEAEKYLPKINNGYKIQNISLNYHGFCPKCYIAKINR